jgi:hypothetical protein
VIIVGIVGVVSSAYSEINTGPRRELDVVLEDYDVTSGQFIQAAAIYGWSQTFMARKVFEVTPSARAEWKIRQYVFPRRGQIGRTTHEALEKSLLGSVIVLFMRTFDLLPIVLVGGLILGWRHYGASKRNQ